MPRFRISIGGLSAIILGAGIVMAAARSPTESWANGATSLTLLALGLALAGIWFRRGAARAYWAGFAWLGWGYLVLAFGPWCDSRIAPLLINKTIGEFLHFNLSRDPLGRIQFYSRQIPGLNLWMFGHQQVAHSLSALLLALLGGSLARRFASDALAPVDMIGGRSRPVKSPSLVVAVLAAFGLSAVTWGVSKWPPGATLEEFAANGTFCAGLLGLGVAWIAATTFRGPDRAYWAGFAMIGSGYLVLVYGPWFDTHAAPLLITETVLRSLEEQFGPYRRLYHGSNVPPQGLSAPRLIGHTLAALALGLVSGAAARRFAAVEEVATGAGPPLAGVASEQDGG